MSYAQEFLTSLGYPQYAGEPGTAVQLPPGARARRTSVRTSPNPDAFIRDGFDTVLALGMISEEVHAATRMCTRSPPAGMASFRPAGRSRTRNTPLPRVCATRDAGPRGLRHAQGTREGDIRCLPGARPRGAICAVATNRHYV